MLTMRTPEAHQWALDQFAKFKGGGVFEPLNVNADTIVFPGFDGGAEWGGSAADPETGILYVNANDIAWTGGLAPIPTVTSGRSLYQLNCASCHRDDFTGQPPQFPSLVDIASSHTNDELKMIIHDGGGRMAGFPSLTAQQADAIIRFITTGESLPSTPAAAAGAMPYRFTGYKKFLDPDGYPAIAPPWGTLSAINLNTGEFAWQIPLGEYPELVAKGIKNTGSENYGGPIVTAGGLVFIGATNFDHKIRAFDKATGELLWEATMPFSGGGAPATYEINGRQYVAIAAGGGKAPGGSGGAYVAFALPK
jgi:quinoprotein glucose dehydrogenase